MFAVTPETINGVKHDTSLIGLTDHGLSFSGPMNAVPALFQTACLNGNPMVESACNVTPTVCQQESDAQQITLSLPSGQKVSIVL